MKNTTKKQLYIDSLTQVAEPGQTVFTRAELVSAANSIGMKYAPAWIVQDSTRRVERGTFEVSEVSTTKRTASTDFDRAMQKPDPEEFGYTIGAGDNETKCDVMGNPAPKDMDLATYAMSLVSSSLVPQKMQDFVPWGHFKDIERIIKSGIRANVYVTGLSGNGKTTMIEQVCAKLKKECFRVNITAQTDEDDLLGGFRLVNGETIRTDSLTLTSRTKRSLTVSRSPTSSPMRRRRSRSRSFSRRWRSLVQSTMTSLPISSTGLTSLAKHSTRVQSRM